MTLCLKTMRLLPPRTASNNGIGLIKIFVIAAIVFVECVNGSLVVKNNTNFVKVNKCCERIEILAENSCQIAKDVNETTWTPTFTGYNDEQNLQIDYKFVIGQPDCGAMQKWPIHHYPSSPDKLVLLPDGTLRHYTNNPEELDDDDEIEDAKRRHHDYTPGLYCLEKSIQTSAGKRYSTLYAKVCYPERVVHWTDTEFLLRKIINPIFHGISMCVFMVIAIIYFVLPTLRDLVGNIVTTITLCLIVSQAADLVRILTEYTSHVSFLVADLILYTSLLGAFFWLNSMGYYIWKTFRSRNVFLRVTDGRKYCWYSSYAWSVTLFLSALGVFAHFYLDVPPTTHKKSIIEEQDSIGWLGIAVFFTPIAFIISINLLFYVTTVQIINRMNTYGRIHHKLKSSFTMFSLMFLIMTISWLFLILSWLQFDALLYAHIIVNALQAPLMLYICVLRQKHVTFLLKKSCCYNEPPAAGDWGDEMTYMNTADF